MQKYPKQRVFLVSLGVFILLGIGLFWYFKSVPAGSILPKKQPGASPIKNVVLINIDSLRADYMGTYGNTKQLTPFLDSLFAKGVVFEHAIIPAYLTFQTDAAILSGLYPSQNNVRTWDTRINKNLTLLPNILRMHYFKTSALVNPSMWGYFGWDVQFDSYEQDPGMRNIIDERSSVGRRLTNTEPPFFFFWHIYDLHQPYMVPSIEFFPGTYTGQMMDTSKNWQFEKQTKDTWYYLDVPVMVQTQKVAFLPTNITDEDRQYLKAAYETNIRFVDDQLRLFFESIQDLPIYKDTLFIISSEHGEDMNEHGFIFHRDLYDVNTRVPLAFIHPSLKPKRIKAAVSSLDIMPTILGMLAIPIPEQLEGMDLTPAFEGKPLDPNRSIFSERPPFDEYSVRKGTWKYIVRNPEKKTTYRSDVPQKTREVIGDFFGDVLFGDDTFTDELYDLSKDPTEQHNLIGKGLPQEEQLRKEVAAFREKMKSARETNAAVPAVDPKKLMPYP